jgi:hypothetical protein
MAINDFFRDPKDQPKEWKTAYLLDKANNRIAFRYNRIPSSQLSKISMFQGVFMSKDQMMIMTTCNLSLDHTSKIIIDGFQYSFVSENSGDSENENNQFGIHGTPAKRYIVLVRPK